MPRTQYSRFFLLTVSCASMMALTACSSDSNYSADKTLAPMPPISEMDAAMNAPAPQPLSTTDTLTPVMPAAPGTTTSITTMTTSAPADESVEARIARLEQSVGSLKSDYDRIMPAFASLNTTNERISALLDEIEKETGKRYEVVEAPAPVPVAPVKTTTTTVKTEEAPVAGVPAKTVATTTTTTETTPAPSMETAVAPADLPPSSGKASTVTSVRIGEHGSKTRLVMDLTSKTKPDFKYDLDNGEKLLLVDLPSSAWSGAPSGKAANSPLIEGWTVQKGASGGSTVAIQLKKNARILSTEFLKAEGKDPARLVMDIAAGG